MDNKILVKTNYGDIEFDNSEKISVNGNEIEVLFYVEENTGGSIFNMTTKCNGKEKTISTKQISSVTCMAHIFQDMKKGTFKLEYFL